MKSATLRAIGCVAALLAGLAPRAAAAQDEAAADAQFERGLADMQAGRYATGCPALAESYKLDPQPGALFTLAECEAKWNKLATAVTHYEEYLGLTGRMTAAELAKQGERPAIARERRLELGPRIPTLTITVRAPAPAGTIVRRDGVTLGAASLGVPLPVDPGSHVLTVQAPDGTASTRNIDVAAGAKLAIELEMPPAPLEPRSPAAPEGVSAPPSTSRRTWVYVAGGVGILGVAVGIVSGLVVLHDKGVVDDECLGATCTQTGKDAADRGKSLSWVSTAGFGVAVLGLATAGVLLATEGPGAKSTSAEAHRGRRRSITRFVGPRGLTF